MTVAPAATPGPEPSDPLRFDRFLRGIERRAIRVAELGEDLHPRAVEHVARAMAGLASEWRGLPEADWAVAFWQRLQRRLAAVRGQAAARAFERRHDEESAREGEDPLAAEDALTHLEAALRALSSPQRLAFLLRVWEGLELDTVAVALDAPVGQVRTDLFHALQRLHARLAPGATDRAWVLRCRALLDGWAEQIEPPSLAPLAAVRRAVVRGVTVAAEPAAATDWVRRLGLAALLGGAALLGWRGWTAWQARTPGAPVAAIEPLAADAPPPAWVEPAPVAAPDYELLADAGHYALLEDLEFVAWQARERDAAGD